MTEQEINKYLNKIVVVTDFENQTFFGLLKRIKNYKYKDIFDHQTSIKHGYVLIAQQPNRNNTVFYKSYIKSIRKLRPEAKQ